MRWSKVLLIIALSVMVSACLSDLFDDDNTTDYGAQNDSEFLINYMQDWYLWEDRLPATVNSSDYASDQAALEALKVPEDRYSNIASALEYNRFFDEGKTVGFGLSYRIEEDQKAIRVYMVQPSAPAAAAGLLRGDLITAIEGEDIETLVAQNRLNDAFGPLDPGVTRTFTLTRNAANLNLAITKDLYDISYVLADGVFDLNGRKVGYINFFSFAVKGLVPWRDSLDRLLAAGAQDLIVDLRSNGGGLLSTTAQIGSMLGGNSLSGKVMSKLAFNSKHPGSDRSYTFVDDPRSGRFDRLVWLTSRSSCSASEALIVGLDPHRNAVRIGETTCGKPVGFTPPTFNDKVYSIVSFRLENSTGTTDYFDGLQPTCTVADDGLGQLGSADEPLTQAALNYLDSGVCPQGPAATKALRDIRTLDQMTNRPSGLTQLINLW